MNYKITRIKHGKILILGGEIVFIIEENRVIEEKSQSVFIKIEYFAWRKKNTINLRQKTSSKLIKRKGERCLIIKEVLLSIYKELFQINKKSLQYKIKMGIEHEKKNIYNGL